jgi:beta-lactamase superfamily II metal-dependent hydrolase
MMFSLPTNSPHSLPPAPDEFELSVFGAGVGESIVAHLGDGDWLVVDSCLNPETGTPIALDYFNALQGHKRPAILAIVLTHWHDDHTSGAVKILESAPAADLVCSTAFKSDEFKRALEAIRISRISRSGLDELGGIFEALLARKQSPKLASANRLLRRTNYATVTSLSPADSTVWNAFHNLAPLLVSAGRPRRRVPQHSQNDASIVLWLEFGSARVLLGGDLETGGGPDRGWRAILTDRERSSERGSIFKVAHHGSPDADLDGIWSDLLMPSPISIVTPFTAGRLPRPTEGDVNRLLSRTTDLHLAASARTRKPHDLSKVLARVVREHTKEFRRIDDRLGQVRLRVPPGRRPIIEHFGAAKQLFDSDDLW